MKNRVFISVTTGLIVCAAAGLFPRRATAAPFPYRPENLIRLQQNVDTTLPFAPKQEQNTVAARTVWFHLACLSAKLRMYPLAMKFFLKSAHQAQHSTQSGTDSPAGEWHFTAQEDSLLAAPEKYADDSRQVGLSELLDAFTDTGTADRYALILLIKQPVFNRRKVFTGIGNVGHSFISLIRFNRDHSYVSRTFGFYPRKKYPLAASPLFPDVPGMFRNDDRHDWDEMAGRFITKTQFRAIIHAMQSYAGRRYHLSRNNCTDFGLRIAAIGGIRVEDSIGSWPLGRGNNPAWAGQSILSRDVCVTDSTASGDIFIAVHHPEKLTSAALH